MCLARLKQPRTVSTDSALSVCLLAPVHAVRVYEEPRDGLQLVSPHFLRDVAGRFYPRWLNFGNSCALSSLVRALKDATEY